MNKSQTIKSERKIKEKTARRDAILKAAKDAFFKNGFMDTTVDNIADKCGLAKGTIYLYFKSKEEIYVSLMINGLKLLKKEMEKAVRHELPSDATLERLLDVYYNFYLKNRKYFRIIFLSSHPDMRSRVSEELLKTSIDISNDCLTILSHAIKRGIESGFFKMADSWMAANILWATANGLIMNYEKDPLYRHEIVGVTLEKILKESLNLFLDGLRVKH